ncbi:MAG: carbonic anhydrase [Alphaproteobacteria bacterium]|nr:carbonic anhydrase [Alphaproteobacteria bacterium]
MSDISKLISGFRIFKATTFSKQKDIIHHLLEQGQKPSTLVISCADIRLSPAEIFAANPGDLYVINNIGGFIPKYGTSGIAGILSALEYAVTDLEVQNIIVLGHAKCDGIKMMMSEKFVSERGMSEAMKTWLSVASEARNMVKKQLADKTPDEQQSACEHESIIITLRNLLTYPYINKRIDQNKLGIFGWHFDVENGEIMAFNPDTRFFEPII